MQTYQSANTSIVMAFNERDWYIWEKSSSYVSANIADIFMLFWFMFLFNESTNKARPTVTVCL